MRELERDSSSEPPACASLTIVGRGRLGNALAQAFAEAGLDVLGPLGRQPAVPADRPVLLCVPDGEIAAAAAAIAPAATPYAAGAGGPIVGHCSGATRLDVLFPHEAFSLHPLMTVTTEGAEFAGAGAAVAGTTPRALAVAHSLAHSLAMAPVEVAEHDRATYHAAASVASNFLVTLEATAERLAAAAGVDREHLVPLVRATVENWARIGPERALTGPVARGDEATVAVQRQAVADSAPELLPLFEALVTATRELAHGAREPQPA
jgi:predicted short-subunit dehydrogenase-like oxidoreductase (DUF2520 family)